MKRDSVEGCQIRKKYAAVPIVIMQEQRKRRGIAVLPVGEDWPREKSGYRNCRMVVKNSFSEHPPHYLREDQKPI